MHRALVIGLDSVPYKFIEIWKENIKKFDNIIKDSILGTLKSTIPSQTSIAMPSILTGKNPAKTGIFGFLDDFKNIVRIDRIKGLKIWDFLDNGGIKSLFYNTRLIYPLPKTQNCVFIDSGLMLNSRETLCVPEKYVQYLDNFDREGKLIEWWIKDKPSQIEFSNRVIEVIENKYEVFKKIISDNNYDFIFYWIGETDLLHHYCWNNKEILLDAYEGILDVVKNLIDEFRDWNVFIISDHGAEKKPSVNFHIDAWLASKGYLKMNTGAKLYSLIYSVARKLIPFEIRNKLISLKSSKGVQQNDFIRYPGINYQNSLAYYSKDWGISINKNNAKEKYERIREKLIEDLSSVEFDGKKVFREIMKREEIYNGPYLNKVPDIILRAEEDFEIKPGPSLKIFGKAENHRYGYVGSHNWARDGIFLAKGPDIRNDGSNVGEIQIYDIMPTILHMYGIPIPEDVDGRVLREIFREDSEFYRREPVYTKIDQERIIISDRIKKLKKLGKL